jgi:hypothetical protein
MKKILLLLILVLVVSCGRTPENYMQKSSLPPIFPDYANITIPYNIAPLNFYVQQADNVSLLIKGGKGEYKFSFSSSLVSFSPKKWKSMLLSERGNTLEVFIRAIKGKSETGYRSFMWEIAEYPVDKYLSYRLIEPAYEVWNMISICERNVENYDVRVIGDNNITDHSCMNCHTSNRSDNSSSFIHIRGKNGGTIYANKGEVRKINTKTEKTSGSAVYGELDKSGRYGVFTTAEIFPILHSEPLGRLEVYDTSSDLILADFEENNISDSPLISGDAFQETFPCFSSDDSTIYFCRSERHFQPDSTEFMHYNLYSIPFEKSICAFGDSISMIVDAESMGKSISFPKCSPDGKYILFSVSDYGTFPIWHQETDLWLYEISTGKINKMENANGPYSDSYHCWSTNSKWIVWASKRGDRVYGRPYYSYINDKGEVSKPFLLPQKDPNVYITTLKSYNIPEMYDSPEVYDAHKVRELYFKHETETMNYK